MIEECRIKTEETKKKARIHGALWFKDNTSKRHPEGASFLKWFESSNEEGNESTNDGT